MTCYCVSGQLLNLLSKPGPRAAARVVSKSAKYSQQLSSVLRALALNDVCMRAPQCTSPPLAPPLHRIGMQYRDLVLLNVTFLHHSFDATPKCRPTTGSASSYRCFFSLDIPIAAKLPARNQR